MYIREFKCGCIKKTNECIRIGKELGCPIHKTLSHQIKFICESCNKEIPLTSYLNGGVDKKFCALCKENKKNNIHVNQIIEFECGCKLQYIKINNDLQSKYLKKILCLIHQQPIKSITYLCKECNSVIDELNKNMLCESCINIKNKKKMIIPKKNYVRINQKMDCLYYDKCLTLAAINNFDTVPCSNCDHYIKIKLNVEDFMKSSDLFTNFDI